jgi:hypothetical protein
MLVAQISNLVPMDYREAFPNTSFPPNGPTDEFLADQGFAKVNVWRDHDSKTQKLMPCNPVYEAPWVYTVAVTAKTADDIASDNAALAGSIRAQRNALLAASDWTQLADSPVDKSAWAVYRQALRDITKQPGFPQTVEFPTQP